MVFKDGLVTVRDFARRAQRKKGRKVLTGDDETPNIHVTVGVATIYPANTIHVWLYHSVVTDYPVYRVELKREGASLVNILGCGFLISLIISLAL